MKRIFCGIIVTASVLVIAGCASLDMDPREYQWITVGVAADGLTSASATITAPTPWFVEPRMDFVAESTVYKDGSGTTTRRAEVNLGADSKNSTNFFAKWWDRLCTAVVALAGNAVI